MVIILTKKTKVHLQKRYMQSRCTMHRLTQLGINSNLNPSSRNYPGEYSSGQFSYDTVRGNGKKLLPHEYNHRIIRRNRDGVIVRAFTTDPKPEFKSDLIDSETYVNGKPVVTSDTGQYATSFKSSKIVDEPVEGTQKHIFKPDPKTQAYMDKNENKFKELYDKTNTREQEVRIDKNDSRFYHENGQRDYENFP